MKKLFLLFAASFMATVINLQASDTTPFSVFYPLNQTTEITPTVTGDVIAFDESFSNAAVYNYATAITAGPPELVVSATDRVQRIGLPENAAWPQETALAADRYVQFAVKPNEGTNLTVDSIGLYVGPSGSNGIGYAVMASTDETFAVEDTLAHCPSGNTNGTMYAVSYNKIWTVPEGETLYIRVYFWQSGAAASRLIFVKNVTIQGSVAVIIDKTNLQLALSDVDLLSEAEYTPATWAILMQAVEAGETVLANPEATQGEVDAAITAINDAISGLALGGLSMSKTAVMVPKVYVQNLQIVVEAVNGSAVNVINLLGSPIFAGKISNEKMEISIAKGIYIVTIDGKATKIAVK